MARRKIKKLKIKNKKKNKKIKKGPITLENGIIYEGEWVKKARDGYGV